MWDVGEGESESCEMGKELGKRMVPDAERCEAVVAPWFLSRCLHRAKHRRWQGGARTSALRRVCGVHRRAKHVVYVERGKG